MKAVTISFISAKGGSGKTITSSCLAAFLSFIGKQILIIDCDSATNGLTLFLLDSIIDSKSTEKDSGHNGSELGRPLLGIFDLANDNKQVDTTTEKSQSGRICSVIRTKIFPSFFVIPATFLQIRTQDVDVSQFEISLRKTIGQYGKDFDYIFLDAQAGADEFAEAAVRCSDENVIVSEFDPVSVQGVERLKKLMSDSLDPNRTWVLYNKLLPEIAEKFSEFLMITRILSPIPWDVEVIRAFAKQELPLNMENGSSHTFAIMRTARMLFRRKVEADINSWLAEKESQLKEPSRRALQNYDDMLDSLRTMQKDINIEMRTGNLKINLLSAAIKFIFGGIILAVLVFLAYMYLEYQFDFVYQTINFVWSSQFLAIFLTSVVVIIALFLLKLRLFKENVILEEEEKTKLDVLQRKIDEVYKERRKMKALLESDIEELVK